MAESFSNKFIDKCQDLQIDPPRSLIELMNSSANNNNNRSLNLTGHTLSTKLCSALGASLKDDTTYKELVIGDAFLGDDGCIFIANALKTNCCVTAVDLRGNNIRSDGATALSQMLKMNNTMKKLSLEWNCLGIWESGIRTIADAIITNGSLEELDLRNNKIGPQGTQSLAISLKHNTSLRKLDFRWNNAGIIGGRALVDMLKWNTTLIEIDLNGNEIPEDIAKSIAISVERNRDRFKKDLENSAHTSHLTSTLQSLTASHAHTLKEYTEKYHNSEHSRSSLSSQLEKGIKEIKELNDIKRALETQLVKLREEHTHLEQQFSDEKRNHLLKTDALQRDVVAVREGRFRSDDLHSTQLADATKKALECESNLSEKILESEVLKKDKRLLLDELDQSKKREHKITILWEDKHAKLESLMNQRLSALEASKDKEFGDKVRKLEERLKANEDLSEYEKTKFQTRKHQLEEKLSDTEAKHRRDEETMHKEQESQLHLIRTQRDTLQQQLTTQSHAHTKDLLDLESSLLKKSTDSRESHSREMDAVQCRVNTTNAAHATLTAQFMEIKDKTDRERRLLEERVAGVDKEAEARLRRALEKYEDEVRKKDIEIQDFKATVRKLDDEIDERDAEHHGKMKDLQVAINSLMASRSMERKKY